MISLFENIFDSLESFISVFNMRGEIVYQNKAILDYFNLNPDETFGKKIWDLQHWASTDVQKNEIKKIVDFFQNNPNEKLTFYQKAGNGQYFEINLKTIKDENNNDNILMVSRNITDKWNVEKAYDSSIKYFKMLMEQAPFGIQIMTTDGITRQVNPQWEKIWDTGKEVVVDKYNVIEDPQAIALNFDEYFRSALEDNFVDIPVFEYDPSKSGYPGRRRWLKGKMYPLKDHDLQIVNIVLTLEDVTEKTEMEIDLQKQQENNFYLLQAIPDLMFRLDSAGNVLDYRTPQDDLLAAPPDEVIGSNVYEISTDDNFKEITKEKIKECLETGELQVYEYFLNLPMGKRYFESRLVKTGDDETLSIIRDITDKKRYERKLIEAQRMDSIGNLAGGVAHDFNNMLAAISGYTELLLAEESDSSKKESLNAIMKAVRRSSDLTQKLLGFGRRGKNIVEAVDIVNIIEEVIVILKHSVSKNIEIWYEKEDSSMYVDADPGQLNQVIMNLALNAAESIPKKGKVEFRIDLVSGKNESETLNLKNDMSYIKISISDNGVGIDSKVVSHIFEPFYTTKKDGDIRGTGLGLSTVWGIVHNHGGTIDVKSRVGEGSTFIVYLPEGTRKYESEILDNSCDTKFPGKKVLIVDDEPYIRNVLSQMLMKLEMTTVFANEGQSAIDIYKNEIDDIDCIILDMKMPGMTALEIVKKLLNINSNVRIVLSTGYGQNEEAQRIIDIGAFGFLSKPYTMAMVQEQMRKIFSK